jgi:hypothetical protein
MRWSQICRVAWLEIVERQDRGLKFGSVQITV